MKDSYRLGLSILGIILLAVAFTPFGKDLYSKAVSKVKPLDPLSIEALRTAELEHIERAKHSMKPSTSEARLKRIEFEQSNNLARQDVSEFFKNNIPLDEPNLKNSYLNAWAALGISDIMTFGFNDYKYRLSMSSGYFTEKGFGSFTQALGRFGIIEMLEVNQRIITAAPKGAPVWESQGNVAGRYQWRIQLPLVLTYRSGAKTLTKGLLVTVVIVRSDDPRHPYGIAIDQWMATER